MLLNLYEPPIPPRDLEAHDPAIVDRFQRALRIIVGQRSPELLEIMRGVVAHPEVPRSDIVVLNGPELDDGLTLLSPLIAWLGSAAAYADAGKAKAIRGGAEPVLLIVAAGEDSNFLQRLAAMNYRHSPIRTPIPHPTRIYVRHHSDIDGIGLKMPEQIAAKVGELSVFPARWLGTNHPELQFMIDLKHDLNEGGWRDVIRWLAEGSAAPGS